jgi:multidrug efflux system outer membrane protein
VFSNLVAGCMLGPNYRQPAIEIPSAYRAPSEGLEAQSKASSFADLPWWQVFKDPQLQELIRTALKQNYDIRLATERINAARAQLVITRSSLFPQVQGSGDFTGGKDPTSHFSSTCSAGCGEPPKHRARSSSPPKKRSVL